MTTTQPPQQSPDPIYASIPLPDPTRAATGAWLLPHNRLAEVDAFRRADPNRTEAEYWALAGATWDEDWFSRTSSSENMILYIVDPKRTAREITDDGVMFVGAWKMTLGEKRVAFGLREREREREWSWGRCFEEVGARWDGWCKFILLFFGGGCD
jgi:hypothetical protein